MSVSLPLCFFSMSSAGLAARLACPVIVPSYLGRFLRPVGPIVLRLALHLHVSCHCSVSPAILSCCSHRPERCQSLQHSMLHRFCGCHCCLHSSISTSTCPASAGLSWPSPANRLTYFYVVSSSTSILSPPSPVLVCSFSICVLLPGSCNCASASLASWRVPEQHDILVSHTERKQKYWYCLRSVEGCNIDKV